METKRKGGIKTSFRIIGKTATGSRGKLKATRKCRIEKFLEYQEQLRQQEKRNKKKKGNKKTTN